VANFDAEKDATALKEAMRGWGCENEDIIAVLSKRSSNQRESIEEAYKNLFGKDLLEDLKGELGGNFERLVVALMFPWPQLGARALKKACKGAGTNEQTLIDILCTANNCQIKSIAEAYKEMFDDGLENLIESELAGDFQNLMVAIVQGARHEDDQPNAEKAKEDATRLLEAGELKWGTDESSFTAVLVRNSYAQLRAISAAYQEIADKTLEEVVDSELSAEMLNAAKTILAVANSSDGYWAKRLHDSMAGLGTDDKALINIIVARSEIDLGNIKKEFEKLYEQSLESWIEDECSGDYKKLLIALIAG
jgi:annexin A7/11